MRLLKYENFISELREEQFRMARTRFPAWGVQPSALHSVSARL